MNEICSIDPLLLFVAMVQATPSFLFLFAEIRRDGHLQYSSSPLRQYSQEPFSIVLVVNADLAAHSAARVVVVGFPE